MSWIEVLERGGAPRAKMKKRAYLYPLLKPRRLKAGARECERCVKIVGAKKKPLRRWIPLLIRKKKGISK